MIKYLFIFFPFIFLLIHITLTHYTKNKFDFLLSRKLYYFLALLWELVFLLIFSKEIKSFTIYTSDNLNTEHFNILLITLLIFFIIIILDWFCISNKSINTLKILGNELTLNDLEKVRYKEDISTFEKNTLYNILNAQFDVMEFINNSIEKWLNDESISYRDMYYKVIEKYCQLRNIYFEIKKFSRNTVLSSVPILIGNNISKDIMGVITSDGFWEYKNPKKNSTTVLSKISLLFLDYPILVILQSKLLIDNEYIKVIELINYLELKLDNEGLIRIISKTSN